MGKNINSFGLEGNEERFNENVELFLDKVQLFKTKEWQSLQHLADVAVTNTVLLEHFLLLAISYSINNEPKNEQHYQELISAFNEYKNEMLTKLEQQRKNNGEQTSS